MIKIKKSTLKLILIIIILIYISSYYIANSGYYEYDLQRRTVLTNEKIKEFEEDVKNNKDIDVKNYLENEETDYSNKITDIVYNSSDKGTKLVRKLVKYVFKKIGDLVED